MAAGLMPGIVADRRSLRKVLIERRLALPADAWDGHCRRVCALLQAGFPQLSCRPVFHSSRECASVSAGHSGRSPTSGR